VRTADLNDASLSAEDLAARVEDFAAKTLSDSITMDDEVRRRLQFKGFSAPPIVRQRLPVSAYGRAWGYNSATRTCARFRFI
jgi:hypothetical protein